jgi:hypothetical protein
MWADLDVYGTSSDGVTRFVQGTIFLSDGPDMASHEDMATPADMAAPTHMAAHDMAAPAPDAGAVKHAHGCGCDVGGAATPIHRWTCAMLVACVLLARRRRRRE